MRIVTISLALLFTCVAWCTSLDLTRWSHMAQIQVNNASGKGVAEFAVSPAIFDLALPDLTDLRVVADNGEEVGYVTRATTTTAQSVQTSPQLFNRTYLPGKHSRVTVVTLDNAAKNRVQIDTSGANFRRTVLIEASDDGRHWEAVRDHGVLFRATEDGAVIANKEDVEFPENSMRYLRITVFNGPDDPGTITINDVTIERQVFSAAEVTPVPVRSQRVMEKRSQTIVTADLGMRNLPLQQIALNASEANFFRQVTVYGRNAKTRVEITPVEDAPDRTTVIEEPWAELAAGAIYRYTGGGKQEASLNVALENARARYLKIVIENEDNPPLHLAGLNVKRYIEYVDFKPEPGAKYRLYVGNAAAQTPRYDLPHYIDALRAEGVTQAALGLLMPNPQYAAAKPPSKPWSERHQGLLWLAILIIFAILALLIKRQLATAKAMEAKT